MEQEERKSTGVRTKLDRWAEEIAGLFFDRYITTSEGRAENPNWFQAKAVAVMAFEKCREEVLKATKGQVTWYSRAQYWASTEGDIDIVQSLRVAEEGIYGVVLIAEQLGLEPAEEDLATNED